jgi:hypothetical protein
MSCVIFTAQIKVLQDCMCKKACNHDEEDKCDCDDINTCYSVEDIPRKFVFQFARRIPKSFNGDPKFIVLDRIPEKKQNYIYHDEFQFIEGKCSNTIQIKIKTKHNFIGHEDEIENLDCPNQKLLSQLQEHTDCYNYLGYVPF